MPSVWMNYNIDSGCPYHRLLQPARFCGDSFRQYGWDIQIGNGLPPDHNVYFFHGLPTADAVLEFMRIKKRGAKVVWGLDDDWLSIPEWNPAKPKDSMAMELYDIAKMVADWILVSTPHLASTFDDVKEKVLVAPNLLDLSAFPEHKYETVEHRGREMKVYDFSFNLPIRVVWSGGITHREDIKLLEDPLDKLLTDHKESDVVVIFQGHHPPPLLVKRHLHKGLYHQPSVPFASYQKVLNSINPQVYLAPQSEIEFNLSKSNLRVMEGWALLAAPIATPWGEYNCVKPGHDGRFASSSDEWYSFIHRLVTDHQYRCTLASNGRQRVEECYSWENPRCRQPWLKAFATILETPIPIC